MSAPQLRPEAQQTPPQALRPLREHGARRGLANLLRKEAAAWTRTRLGLVQLLLWPALLLGLQAVPLVALRELFTAEFGSPADAALDMFLSIGALAPAAGAVILAHGVIIGERTLGTAAWVLSKPVARSAFVLAKLLVLAAGLLLCALAVPAAATFALQALERGAPLPVLPYLAAVGLLALHLLWYLALTLLLGTLTNARGAVLAVPLVSLVGGDVLIGALPSLAEVGPWLLSRMAVVIATGGPLVTPWPLLSSGIAVLTFVTLALWRFNREEL